MLPSEYIRSFEPGEILFEEGSVGEHLYVVLSGSVEITRRAEDHVVPIATIGPGEFFGEMAVIEEAPRLATAGAGASGASVALINQGQFVYLVSHQPVFALMVLEALSRRLRETTDIRFHAAIAARSEGAPP